MKKKKISGKFRHKVKNSLRKSNFFDELKNAINSQEVPIAAIEFLAPDYNKKYISKVSRKDSELFNVIKRLNVVKKQMINFHRDEKEKHLQLLELSTDAINRNNFLGFALLSRGILENAVSYYYLVEKINIILVQIKQSLGFKRINALLEQIENHLDVGLKGSRFFKKQTNVESINIITKIDFADRKFTKIRWCYDFLSEFCHPNFGSFVISNNKLLIANRELSATMKKSILDVTGTIIITQRTIVQRMEKLTIDIQRIIEIALDPKIVITNLFLERSSNFVGDGDSEDSAIYFTDAASSNEHIQFQHDYLKKNKIVSIRKSSKKIKQYFIDIHWDGKRNYFFKVPISKQEYFKTNKSLKIFLK